MGAQRCLPWPGAALDRPGCWSPAGLRGWNADSRHVTRRHLWITEVPDGTQKLHFFVRNRVQNTNGMNVCHVSMCAISFQKSEASPKTHAYMHAVRFMCPICSICTGQTRLLHRQPCHVSALNPACVPCYPMCQEEEWCPKNRPSVHHRNGFRLRIRRPRETPPLARCRVRPSFSRAAA